MKRYEMDLLKLAVKRSRVRSPYAPPPKKPLVNTGFSMFTRVLFCQKIEAYVILWACTALFSPYVWEISREAYLQIQISVNVPKQDILNSTKRRFLLFPKNSIMSKEKTKGKMI